VAALVSIGLFCLLTMSIAYVGYRHYARPGRFYEQLGGTVVSETPYGTVGDTVVRVIQLIGERVPVSPQEATLTRRQLMAAGHRSDAAVPIYYGFRVLSGLVALAFSFILRDYFPENPSLRLVLVGLGGVAGYFAPSLILDLMVSSRRETLRLSLPDALDLMVVCVEAGLGLDQAIVVVSRELQITHPEISEEFGLVTLEIRAGKRRIEALRNLAQRTGEGEIRKLVAILVQTDRFGTSMAEALRAHSEFQRVRRRQAAEERAGKVGVKLVFPIFFCILPAMLVVVAGPGLLQIMKHLFPLMRQFSGVAP